MKKKRNLVLFAALFVAGMLSTNRFPAEAAGEQEGQERNAEVQDEGTTVREETLQPMSAQSGTCGENVTWTFDESSGTLTISGMGEMSDVCGVEDKEKVISIVIEHGVTDIVAHAFEFYTDVKEVKIPDSVTKIGDYAFYNCVSLTEIRIPDSVTDIGSDAFFYCYNLTEIKLSDSVVNIGPYAFCNHQKHSLLWTL